METHCHIFLRKIITTCNKILLWISQQLNLVHDECIPSLPVPPLPDIQHPALHSNTPSPLTMHSTTPSLPLSHSSFPSFTLLLLVPPLYILVPLAHQSCILLPQALLIVLFPHLSRLLSTVLLKFYKERSDVQRELDRHIYYVRTRWCRLGTTSS